MNRFSYNVDPVFYLFIHFYFFFKQSVIAVSVLLLLDPFFVFNRVIISSTETETITILLIFEFNLY